MRIGALFAGYGGLDLAVEEVFGATTAWVSEFDAAPSRILAERFPEAPNHGDVTKIKWAPDCPDCGAPLAVYYVGGDAHRAYWCREHGEFPLSIRFDDPDSDRIPEPVDAITGGSPCQDLSHAGKRAGMKAGTRSGLWASMCDAIETIRPAFVVWENVRGALSAEADSAVEPCPICVGDGRGVSLRALGRVLGDLAELGYDACWTGLRAADVGAPHGRFRVFVLAWDATRPAGLGGAASTPVAADLGHERTGTSRDRRTGPADGRGGPVALLPTPAVNDMGASYDVEKWDAWTARMKAAHGNGNGHGNSLHVEALRLLPTPKATNNENEQTPREGDTGYGPNLGMALRADFGQYAPAIARWETVLGRPAPAPTEPTGKGGAHRLSPRFVEWMMGLPDGWVTDTDTTRNEQLKALGNGVVPQQASAALRHMLTLRAAALEGVAA